MSTTYSTYVKHLEKCLIHRHPPVNVSGYPYYLLLLLLLLLLSLFQISMERTDSFKKFGRKEK